MKTLASVIFIERPVEDLDWVVFVLVFTLLVIVVGRLLFANNFQALGNLERFVEVNDNQGIFSLSFQIVFAVLGGALLVPYLISDYDFVFYTPTLKMLGMAGIILLFFLFRYLFQFLGIFAFKIPLDQNLSFRSSSYYRVYSVIVLWIAVLLYYFSDWQKLSILLIAAVILLIIRGLQIVYKYRNQQDQQTKIWYYNILYLCALEILPLLVLFKFLNLW